MCCSLAGLVKNNPKPDTCHPSKLSGSLSTCFLCPVPRVPSQIPMSVWPSFLDVIVISAHSRGNDPRNRICKLTMYLWSLAWACIANNHPRARVYVLWQTLALHIPGHISVILSSQQWHEARSVLSLLLYFNTFNYKQIKHDLNWVFRTIVN